MTEQQSAVSARQVRHPSAAELMSDDRSAPAAALDVSVVLPCLNEEASVATCVREAQNAVSAAGWRGEVIVVDNGSTDRSAERAAEAGARVVHESVRGYGSAILSGIRVARGHVVVMADADATYPLDRLADVAGPVLNGDVDLMVGTRLESASMESMPLLHRFVGTPVLTWLVRNGTGTDAFSDSQSGFRAFDRELADRLALRCTGMEFASEMLIRAAQHGVSVSEVPLGYRARVGESKLSTWRDGMRHLRLILGLTPHLLLWWPGLASLLLGIVVYGASLMAPQGQTLGGPTWQPVFFGTILVVLGLVFAMSGALLARYSPTVAPGTRSAFMWVSDPHRIRQAWRAGLGLLVVGVTLEVVLFTLWLSDATVSAFTRLQLASLAQGLLLCGVLLVAGVGMYSLVVARRLFEPLGEARAQG